VLAILTLAPVTAPADVGAKVTVKVADWPAVKIVPFETPLAVKPAPVTVTPETVTLEFPLFVSTVVRELLLPTDTVLKFRLVGLAPSNWVAAEPVPERLITKLEGLPFVTSVSDPLMGAVEAGVKTTLSATLPPGATVVDVVRPVMLKPAPAGVTCENVRAVFPAFVIVIGCELPFPTTTVPKLTLEGFDESWACSPVPLRVIVAGAVVALLVIEILPAAPPATVGANVTVKILFAPALMVVGAVRVIA
jgi:hypothetical protein